MTVDPSQTPSPVPDPEYLHLRRLFIEAQAGPGANVHVLGNTIGWLGALGSRAVDNVPALQRIVAAEPPPFGAWSIRAVAALALARIDPQRFQVSSEGVLVDLATSAEFGKHVAGTLVLGWMGKVTAETFARLEAVARAEGADPRFRSWFQEHGFRLRETHA